LNVVLCRRHFEIQLYKYDLTNGVAASIAPMLFGADFNGLWHTSIVVYGREYWFGGNVFEAEPGTTPFGLPNHVLEMGNTMRTKADLWNFIQRELVDDFMPGTYDVLTHNGNHFTNEISRFLLNHTVPLDFMRQPEMMNQSPVAELVRPALNRALGGFDVNTATSGEYRDRRWHPPRCKNEKDAADEWARVERGTLVSYEYRDGWWCVARVTGKSGEACDVNWLDLLTGIMKRRTGVSRVYIHALRRSNNYSPRGLYGLSEVWYYSARGSVGKNGM